MFKTFSHLLIFICFVLTCSNNLSNRNLEEDVIDDCFEFITKLIPVRLENLENPIDFEKELLPLGYYQPKAKYEFKVCKESNLNDCVLRYSNETTYTPIPSDRDYKKTTGTYEMHGKTLYRTNSYVFKYESYKLKLDEGLTKDSNGNFACKEGYRSCGKFLLAPLKAKYSMLCFPWAYDCPYKDIKGGSYELNSYSEHVQLEKEQFLCFERYKETDAIDSVFTGFMYVPHSQQGNLANLPFNFTPTTQSKRNTIFTMDLIDLRELLKENNIYSHYLDFYLKDIGIDTNNTFRLYFNVRFQRIYDLEKKCYNKKEAKEEYVFDNYDNDCLTMIEHVEPIKVNGTEKVYEKEVFKLGDYTPEYDYEHYLCRKSNSSDCIYKYSNSSTYEKDEEDLYYGYEVKSTTDIRDTSKPVYIFKRYAYRVKRLNVNFKETFDTNLYKCKTGYKACARIRRHPWATLLCIPTGHYCPMHEIIGDSYMGTDYYVRRYPYNFKADADVVKFYFNRYQMNDTLDLFAKCIYLRQGQYDVFDKLFPFNLGYTIRGSNIVAFKNRVDNMEKIFTENGIPTNYVKHYYPDDNYIYSMIDDRKTRMYIAAEMPHFKDQELKCENPTSEKEVILYGIWSGKAATGKVYDENDAEDPNKVPDEEPDEETDEETDKKTNKGRFDDDEDCETDRFGYCIDDASDSLRILNLYIFLFICLLFM